MSYKDYIYDLNPVEPVDDWNADTGKEIINPVYSDSNKDYNVYLRDVINGINDSKYKLSGNNVWLPDEDGNLLPLPDWIDKYGGSNGEGGQGVEIPKQYRIEVLSTQGNIIKDKDFTTMLKVTLYEDNEDITEKTDKRYFKWARFSGSTENDQLEDSKWNLKWAEGAKEIPITADDVNRNAMFQVQYVTEKEAQIWANEAYKQYMTLMKM